MVRLRHNIVALLTIAFCLVGQVALVFTQVNSAWHLLVILLSGYLLTWALYGFLSPTSHAELMNRFSLMTASIAMCLLVAEGAALLGVVDYRAVLGSFEPGNALSVAGRHADRELFWQHDPYYQYVEPYQGNLGKALCLPPDVSKKVVVHYDRHGFRNNVDLQQADIVVIGDSYIEGYMTPESKLATTLLGQLQGKTVANLGHSGYGPQQELVVLKRYGLPLHPDTVIWAFFEGNDLSEAERYEEKVARAGNPFWRNLWSRSLTRNVLTRALRSDRQCTPNPEIHQTRASFEDEHHKARPVFFAPAEPAPFSVLQLSKALLYIAEAAKLCRERNIRFIVAFVPEKYRVYHDLSNINLRSDTIQSRPVSNLPDEMAKRLARPELDIEYVDLTPALKTASRKGIATYLADDTHWTDAGNRIMAEALHAALGSVAPQAKGHLEAPPPPRLRIVR
jgi:acetyltransferase AlgX (SGNH hydrolase-like protein)